MGGIESIRERGGDAEELCEKRIDDGAEITTNRYSTDLRTNLAGNEDDEESTKDARLEDRAQIGLVVGALCEIGGRMPTDLPDLADRASCPDADLPDDPGQIMHLDGVSATRFWTGRESDLLLRGRPWAHA